MAAAYHMEALRKQRLIDRKQEAVTRTECLIRSEHEQVRSERRSMRAADKESSNLPEKENDQRGNSWRRSSTRDCGSYVASTVTHDPNFNYRLHQMHGHLVPHVNQIYPLMYPKTCTALYTA